MPLTSPVTPSNQPRRSLCLFTFALVLFLAGHCAAQTIRYVKVSGSFNGSGTSWQNASNNLQNMINASAAGDQVWVAEGEYQPASGFFYMKEGVKIYGGFKGSEQQLTERNHRQNLTVLKGSGYRVLQNDRNGLSAQAVLDGFTLTGGNSARGAGVYNYNSSPTLSNLVIKGNKSSGYGGGVSLLASNSTLTNVIVSGNQGSTGAGMELTLSSPKLINVLISGNLSSGSGGGIYSNDSSPTLTNVTIAGNRDAYQEGGIYQSGGTLTVYNSIVYNNTGGVVLSYGANLVVSHSLLQGSTGTDNGNISGSTDPQFRNPLPPGLSSSGDYALLSTSPVMDMGSNAWLPQGVTTDLAGHPRAAYSSVDMGAYEIQEPSCLTLPQNVAITTGSITTTGATVSWQAPAGESVHGFQYGISTSSGLQPEATTLTSTQTTNASFTGLTPGTKYYVWVRALCSTTNAGTWLVSESFSTLPYNGPLYVKEGGTGDGLSWQNASGDLQAIINAAPVNSEVRVAQGTYYPTGTQSSTNRRQAFLLQKPIKLVGGYNAATGLRNPSANLTALSGNIGNPGSASDNSFTVLHISANVEIDGFTIRDGYANGPSEVIERTGAGVYNTASPTVRNCIFTANQATGNGTNGIGAGWFNYATGANPKLINCLFYGNLASSNGGAFTSDLGHPVIINSTFWGNTTQNSAKGTLNFLNESFTLQNSIVHGNTGKGIHRDGTGLLYISHSLLQDGALPLNSQNQGGNLLATNPKLTNPEGNNFVPAIGSPVIDAGSNQFLLQGITVDLAGNERLLGGTVDMGAFEWQANNPLPVTLTFFKARLQSNKTNLTWQTASELNSKEFIVYRSTDAQQFIELARIPAAGYSATRQDYTFWDEAPLPGINYYRLGQEDIDGSQEHFPVKAVNFSTDKDRLLLFPNPANNADKLQARFRAGKYSLAELQDLHGRILQQFPIGLSTAILEIELSPYRPGTYILRLTGEDGSISGKILKW